MEADSLKTALATSTSTKSVTLDEKRKAEILVIEKELIADDEEEDEDVIDKMDEDANRDWDKDKDKDDEKDTRNNEQEKQQDWYGSG